MGDLEEKLEGILSNPKAMEQIMSLAQSLGKGTGAPASAPPPTDPAPEPAPQQESTDSSGLLGALGQVDPALIAKAAQLMGEYHHGDDRRVALLQALRPFVQEKRYARIDKAIQIAKLSRLIRLGLELLRPKEERHV